MLHSLCIRNVILFIKKVKEYIQVQWLRLHASNAGGVGLMHATLCSQKKKKEYIHPWGFLGGPVVKNAPCNAGDIASIPGPGRSHMP